MERYLVKLFILFLLLSPGIRACIRGGKLQIRKPKPEPPLVYKQHVPNEMELSKDASGGPEIRIRRRSPRFKKLSFNDNPDIIFKDEEMRKLESWMEPYED